MCARLDINLIYYVIHLLRSSFRRLPTALDLALQAGCCSLFGTQEADMPKIDDEIP